MAKKKGIEEIAAGQIREILSEWEFHDMETLITQTGDSFTIPEGLLPENMAKRLAEHEDGRRRRIRKRRRRLLAAVLCIALIACGLTAYRNRHVNEGYQDVLCAVSYEEVYERLQEEQEVSDGSRSLSGMPGLMGSNSAALSLAEDSDGAVGNVNGTMACAKDYTETNIQVEGIAEADSRVTDGRYLYVARKHYELILDEHDKREVRGVKEQRSIQIYDTQGGEVRKLSEIPIGTRISEAGCPYYMEREELPVKSVLRDLYGDFVTALFGDDTVLYVQGDVLAAFFISEENNEDFYQKEMTNIVFYDISDRSHPEEKNTLVQSGELMSSRIADGCLYTVTRDTHINLGDKTYRARYLPQINGGNLPVEKIYLQQEYTGCAYTLITSVQLADTEKYADARAVLGYADDFYMNQDGIYLLGNVYEYKKSKEKASASGDGQKEAGRTSNRTAVSKIQYREGMFEIVGFTSLRGGVTDSFALDEKDGYLRLVMTVQYQNGETDNAVYVLDKNLNLTGKITGIAKGETIYSARFLDDMGYFVTYEQTDPLFSVDFSDPENPELVGELKIPGFSEYMHFYDETHLLGIGRDEDRDCIKLSMFDVSNPRAVVEENVYYLPSDYRDAPALYNYKCVLADLENRIFGFEVRSTGLSWYDLYTYEEKGGFRRIFHEDKAQLIPYEDEIYEMNLSADRGVRGFRIQNMLYVIRGKDKIVIRKYDLTEFPDIRKLLEH